MCTANVKLFLEQLQAVKLEGNTEWGFIGTVLDPVLFNIFINDLDDGIESILIKFPDNTKLKASSSTLVNTIWIESNLDRLKKWSKKKKRERKTQSNKEK